MCLTVLDAEKLKREAAAVMQFDFGRICDRWICRLNCGAVRFPNQQFHPLKFVAAIAKI